VTTVADVWAGVVATDYTHGISLSDPQVGAMGFQVDVSGFVAGNFDGTP
jgi:hypothetical protein